MSLRKLLILIVSVIIVGGSIYFLWQTKRTQAPAIQTAQPQAIEEPIFILAPQGSDYQYHGGVVVSGQYWYEIYGGPTVCFEADEASSKSLPPRKGEIIRSFCFLNGEEAAQGLFNKTLEELDKIADYSKRNTTIKIKNYNVNIGETDQIDYTTFAGVVER